MKYFCLLIAIYVYAVKSPTPTTNANANQAASQPIPNTSHPHLISHTTDS